MKEEYYPAHPLKYFCTVTVYHGDMPTSINDVIGVLHGTLKAIIDKIPEVYLHSSHYPTLSQYIKEWKNNEISQIDFILDRNINIKIPDTDLTYCLNLFYSDIEEDENRIVSRATVLYDKEDPMAEGIPFRILDVYTHDSDDDFTNLGRAAFSEKDFFINAL